MASLTAAFTSLARLDRALTLSIFRPLRTAGLGNGAGLLPVLMYHSISNDPEAGVHPYYRVATSPERFAQQMKWLSELGCRGVSLEEALSPPAAGAGPSGRPVVLTFDDGFRDFYTTAWPVLERHNFTATMYLPTGFIGEAAKSFRGKECLTWSEVRELRTHGIRFGSHTVNHPKLYQLPWPAIEDELSLSKQCLEQQMGEQVDSFAYPFAFPQEDLSFTQPFAEMLQEQGYRSCVTTIVGRMGAGDDPMAIKRLPVNACDDRALLRAKVDGAYDWLNWVQRGTREFKRWRGGAAKSPVQRRSLNGATAL